MKRGEVKFRPKKIRYLRFSEARVRVRVCACRGAKTESRVLILRSNREGCHANGYKTTDSLFSVFLPLINKNFYCGYRCPKLNGIFFLFCSPQKLSACPSACLFVCTSVRRPVRLLFGFEIFEIFHEIFGSYGRNNISSFYSRWCFSFLRHTVSGQIQTFQFAYSKHRYAKRCYVDPMTSSRGAW